ncbi:MAG: thiol-disulfide isomerase/thioredoxin [Myxococcota bacterium]|jgi:thiol-disulfide isomerase/thioredoxin
MSFVKTLRREAVQWSALTAALAFGWVGAASAVEPLAFTDMDGRTHDGDALIEDGTPVVLVFWQTWCGSCKREAPKLVEAVERYGESLKFFGIISGPDDAVDDANVARVAREWHLEHPQIRDRDLTLTKRYKVVGTPAIIVVGRGGKTLFSGHRLPEDWTQFIETPKG